MINYVESGDQLITVYQSKVISTDMIMMLDRQVSKEGIYNMLAEKSLKRVKIQYLRNKSSIVRILRERKG